MLTEIYFGDVFSQYGTVVDLSVKKFEINEVRTVDTHLIVDDTTASVLWLLMIPYVT